VAGLLLTHPSLTGRNRAHQNLASHVYVEALLRARADYLCRLEAGTQLVASHGRNVTADLMSLFELPATLEVPPLSLANIKLPNTKSLVSLLLANNNAVAQATPETLVSLMFQHRAYLALGF